MHVRAGTISRECPWSCTRRKLARARACACRVRGRACMLACLHCLASAGQGMPVFLVAVQQNCCYTRSASAYALPASRHCRRCRQKTCHRSQRAQASACVAFALCHAACAHARLRSSPVPNEDLVGDAVRARADALLKNCDEMEALKVEPAASVHVRHAHRHSARMYAIFVDRWLRSHFFSAVFFFYALPVDRCLQSHFARRSNPQRGRWLSTDLFLSKKRGMPTANAEDRRVASARSR